MVTMALFRPIIEGEKRGGDRCHGLVVAAIRIMSPGAQHRAAYTRVFYRFDRE